MFNFSPYLFKVAIEKMDEKLRDKVNILNNLRYKTVKQQKRLEELCTQYDQMQKDSSDAMATDAGDSDDAQRLRNLENRLDKARLKCQEAEHIRKTYEQIKAKLGEEHKTFENTLDVMEQKIMKWVPSCDFHVENYSVYFFVLLSKRYKVYKDHCLAVAKSDHLSVSQFVVFILKHEY